MRLSALVALLIAALALALLAGCSLGGSTPIAATSTATAGATTTSATTGTLPPTVTGSLGPPPSSCQTSPPPRSMTVTNFGGGFSGTTTFSGAAPAWELGFGTEMQMRGTPYPSTKIMWVVGPNYAQPVVLSGHELTTGAPLWFDVYPGTGGRQDHYTTSATLDPASPNRGSTDNSTGDWNIWGIGIIASAAGCYRLDVVPQSGASWHAVVAVGAAS